RGGSACAGPGWRFGRARLRRQGAWGGERSPAQSTPVQQESRRPPLGARAVDRGAPWRRAVAARSARRSARDAGGRPRGLHAPGEAREEAAREDGPAGGAEGFGLDEVLHAMVLGG